MRTKTNAPAEVAKIVTIALAITFIAVMVALAQLRVDHRQMDPNLKGSSDQTIVPTSQPQVAPR